MIYTDCTELEGTSPGTLVVEQNQATETILNVASTVHNLLALSSNKFPAHLFLATSLLSSSKFFGAEIKTRLLTLLSFKHHLELISYEKVKTFKYLGSLLTNQNSIQEEIKRRLKGGNSCYYSVQTLLSSRVLSKNLKIKICENDSIASCAIWL